MKFITFSEVLELPKHTFIFAFNDYFLLCSTLIKDDSFPPFLYAYLFPDLLELERFEKEDKNKIYSCLLKDNSPIRIDEDDYTYFAILEQKEIQSLIDLLTSNLNNFN